MSSRLKVKGIIGAVAACLSIASYIIYYVAYYQDIKLDELYFISTGATISVFTGLLFAIIRNKVSRTLLLFASMFYAILIISYILSWIVSGFPYAYIKVSLFIGLVIGLIYFLHDSRTSNKRLTNA